MGLLLQNFLIKNQKSPIYEILEVFSDAVIYENVFYAIFSVWAGAIFDKFDAILFLLLHISLKHRLNVVHQFFFQLFFSFGLRFLALSGHQVLQSQWFFPLQRWWWRWASSLQRFLPLGPERVDIVFNPSFQFYHDFLVFATLSQIIEFHQKCRFRIQIFGLLGTYIYRFWKLDIQIFNSLPWTTLRMHRYPVIIADHLYFPASLFLLINSHYNLTSFRFLRFVDLNIVRYLQTFAMMTRVYINLPPLRTPNDRMLYRRFVFLRLSRIHSHQPVHFIIEIVIFVKFKLKTRCKLHVSGCEMGHFFLAQIQNEIIVSVAHGVLLLCEFMGNEDFASLF